MQTCERHQQPEPRLACDECEYEVQHARRDKKHDDDDARRFRDRCALNFAITLAQQGNIGDGSAIAEDAYTFADAMLCARGK